jgi:hypothetical protein
MDELKWLGHIFLTYVLPTGVSALLVGYYFNRRLEKYKNELQAASLIQLEKHKAELDRESKRREILLTKLREQQAVVFEELYKNLILMLQGMWRVTTSYEDKKEDFQNIIVGNSDIMSSFWDHFTTHRIFIPTDIDIMITKFYFDLNSAVENFRSFKEATSSDEKIAFRHSAVVLRDECENIRTEIEKRFRTILEVDRLYDAVTNN